MAYKKLNTYSSDDAYKGVLLLRISAYSGVFGVIISQKSEYLLNLIFKSLY